LVKRGYLAWWGRLIRRACTTWHYTSAEEAAESWPGSGRQFVLPNGIEPDEFAIDRVAARRSVFRRWPELGQRPYVLFLGRLHAKKRLDLLLEAFLAGAPESFHLVVAGPDGEGMWTGLAARFLADPAAARRVHYVGAVAGPEKAALLAGAVVFALPSEHENFGIAALEALAAGTPVMLSPHVDLAQSVMAARVGMVLPLSVGAWKDCLRTISENTEPTGACSWARQNYSWFALTSRLQEHYERMTGWTPSGRSVAHAASQGAR
jgi:glycosyltransferase involved in cell wall biosynthesis